MGDVILKQVFIYKDTRLLYQRIYGNALDITSLPGILSSIKQDIEGNISNKRGSYNFFKNKISFLYDREYNLFFILVTGLVNREENINNEINKLKTHFLMLFKDYLQNSEIEIIKEAIDPFIDSIHRNFKPKISLVGFSGVGKTTISRLIKADEIPMQHIATINGEVSTIKIANLQFLLWDFAGQEQFSLLWNRFIRGSDAVLIISDSTIENVDKNKFFLELIRKESPYASIALIANKQDRTNALKTDEIEKLISIKTYSMIAIDVNNRLKMMQIIADLLEINAEISPLLKPIIERDDLIREAENTLLNGDLIKSAEIFMKISYLCIEIGDTSLSKEFKEKSDKIKNYLKKNNLLKENL